LSDDTVYVRRRFWTVDEKRAFVAEAFSGGNVKAVAKRYGLQTQHLYRWRDRLADIGARSEFVAVSVAPEPLALPAPEDVVVARPDRVSEPARNFTGADGRVEISLADGLRIWLGPGSDADFVVKVALGLSRRRS
jgi:transposase